MKSPVPLFFVLDTKGLIKKTCSKWSVIEWETYVKKKYFINYFLLDEVSEHSTKNGPQKQRLFSGWTLLAIPPVG